MLDLLRWYHICSKTNSWSHSISVSDISVFCQWSIIHAGNTAPSHMPADETCIIRYHVDMATFCNTRWGGCFSVGSCITEESSLMPILRSENLANVSTECFSLHQGISHAHSATPTQELHFCLADEDWSTQSKCQQGFQSQKLVSENSLPFNTCVIDLKLWRGHVLSCSSWWSENPAPQLLPPKGNITSLQVYKSKWLWVVWEDTASGYCSN